MQSSNIAYSVIIVLLSTENGRNLFQDEVKPTLCEKRRSKYNKYNYDTADHICKLSDQACHICRANESRKKGGSSKHNWLVKK